MDHEVGPSHSYQSQADVKRFSVQQSYGDRRICIRNLPRWAPAPQNFHDEPTTSSHVCCGWSSLLILRLSAESMSQITLQRNTIDIGGSGLLTVGKLPEGIDNSSLTWVPVRLYNEQDGGMKPPRFAPGEVSSNTPPLWIDRTSSAPRSTHSKSSSVPFDSPPIMETILLAVGK